VPVATTQSTLLDFKLASVKQSTLQGVKTRGQYTVAIAWESSVRRKRRNLDLSEPKPALISYEKIGGAVKRRNPQWNCIGVLEATTSLFSVVRLIFMWQTVSLVSLGCNVDIVYVWPIVNWFDSSGFSISSTIVKKVPFRGKPSSWTCWMAVF